MWEGVGRANWREFEPARAFVRRLGFKKFTDWLHYCKSGEKPADIPSNAHLTYADAGWVSYGDWLGTDAVAARFRQYRSSKQLIDANNVE